MNRQIGIDCKAAGVLQSEIQEAFVDFQTGRLQNPDDDVWA